jgi:hypothetical protein
VQGFVRRFTGWLIFLCVFALSWDARAWVERTVVSDGVTVDLERSGTALVSHEILLAVRGGPLREFSVDPVDADAEMQPEATATLAKSGQAAGLPIPMSVVKDGTRVTLRPLVGKGLRSGKYAVRFAYRTDLSAAGRVGTRVGRTVVEWSGPSFADGIDSVRVVFRVPRGSVPPRLPSSEAGEAGLVEDELGGVFLSTSRRAADKDELEIVRPHVAKGEVVTWRAVVDGASFDLTAVETSLVAPPEPAPVEAPPRAAPRTSETVPVSIAAGIGVLYALLVFFKGRLVRAACSARRAVPRPLLPIATLLRALLAGAAMSGAAFLVHFGLPTIGGASLMVALAAATHLTPLAPLVPRGPGQWTRLTEAVLEMPKAARLVPGRFLDVTSLRGFASFMLFLGGVTAAAIVVGRRSSYEGVAVALAASALLPLFFTGRAGELPPDPWTAPRALCDWVETALGGDASLSVHPIGRMPLGRGIPDELRVAVVPSEPVSGLVGIEVGLDIHRGAFGYLELPFVIVRVQDGSAAASALPKGLLWTRGRTEDERVAVLRPKVPTRRLTAELSRNVARLMSKKRPQAGTSAERSGGRASSMSKGATRPSPAHAT